MRNPRSHKDIKCPKCGGSPDVYKEFSLQVHEFAVDKNINMIEKNGELESSGILYVIASCGCCDHEWKLRGVSQIIDIQG